jgi:hypothetical protein
MKTMTGMRNLTLGLALAAAMAPAAALAQQSIGVNSAIRNQVQMRTASDAALRAARLRENVHIGDDLSTGQASQLQVLLLDKSVFTVGPNAEMTVDRFVYDPDRNTGDVAASVARGAFRFVSGSPPGPGGRTINTPVGSIGIRGTIVEGAAGPDALSVLDGEPGVPPFMGDPNNAVLVVLLGPGAETRGFDKPGEIGVEIEGLDRTLNDPGYGVLLGGAAPYGPFKLSPTALARLAALLRPAGPEGDRDGLVGPVGLAAGSIFDDQPEPGLPLQPGDVDLPFLLEDGETITPPNRDPINDFPDFPSDNPNNPPPGQGP